MNLKRIFRRIFDFLKKNKKSNLYKLRIVSELPKFPDDEIVYLEGNEKLDEYWYALLKCPCGCKENIVLNLIDDVRPYWQIKMDKSNFSIFPSIWRTKNCKSHFWLKNGKVIFVKNKY
jgi:hypothetical protein